MKDYKESMPHWVCLSCRYLKYSINGTLWCGYHETMEKETVEVSPYGRCNKWDVCDQEQWEKRLR